MYMVIMYFLFSTSFSQNLNLALQDLQDLEVNQMNANGWMVYIKGKAQSYPEIHDSKILESCNVNFMLLTSSPNIYQKTFTIPHFEYNEITIEMDVYFIAFSQSFIRINVDEKIIFQQNFRSDLLQQHNLCSQIDYQYTIYQKFYSSQTQLNLVLFYHAQIDNSQIGIRNLNIYTNGYKLSNGCPMATPYLQGTTCVQYCTNTNPYLGGVDMLVCQTDLIGQSSLIGNYQTSQIDLWKFSNPSPTISQQQYLTAGNYLINNNLYNNIMYSDLFSSALTCNQQCYYISQNIQDTYLLQITLVFYIFGDWDEGSQVGIYISGSTIYTNNMVKISQVRGKYYSSTGSELYYNNITSTTGVNSKVRRTLITFQGKFYSSSVTIGFSQQIQGTGSYGFGNIYVYQSYNDPNIALTGLYGIPYSCVTNYYAYNGYCVSNCPPYSFLDNANNNCTDLAYQQSIIFYNFWQVYRSTNLQGTYLIKDFYDNNFDSQIINSIFQLIPPTYNNYQNGQQFSFIGNKKILGGFNSWGYGSYGIQGTLPLHYQMRISFKLYLIDDWSANDQFIYYLDTDRIDIYKQDQPNLFLQGLSNLDQQISVEKVISHTSQTFKLIFHCSIAAKNSSKASCGISDLFVLYDQQVDVICNQLTNFYSYFTNNCEQCIVSDCYLYPDNQIQFNPKQVKGCLSMDQGFIGECQNCLQPAYVQIDNGICVCSPYYFRLGEYCSKCHYSCASCNGVLENQCLSCDSSIYRQQNGVTCECMSGYFDAFARSNGCQLITTSCHYTCKTCHSQRDNHCVSCPENSFRTLNLSNSCLCNQQYMDIGQAICQFINCDPTCLTCDGLLESNCLSCSTNFRFDNGYCICDGQFNDLQSRGDCQSNSLICSNISCGSSYILGYMNCHLALFRYLNIVNSQQQQCDCFEGYFDQLGICNPCDPSCLTCQNTAIECLTCDVTMNRSLKINQCDCNDGYNDKLAPGQICVLNLNQNCHFSCGQCFGPNIGQCLTCNQQRLLSGSTCLCQSSKYDDQFKMSCEFCNTICLTCNGQSINNCLSCDRSLFRVLSLNQCICQQGYFEVQGECNQCHYSCLSCNFQGQSNCIDCDSSNFRLINNYECKCIDGYADIGIKLCQICPKECINCDSQLKCARCRFQNSILNFNGRCDCIQGYQKNNDGQCIECQSDLGKALFSCQYQNAQDGVWTYGEQCDDGNNDPRDGCNNFKITLNYSCVNTFNQPSICYKCPDDCLNCQQEQDQIVCISCNQNYYNAQFECIQCFDESCLECIKPSYCSVCKNQKIPFEGQCYTCEYGYYYDGQKCSSKCGDGIKTIDEQCDDANMLSCDGCSDHCEIEENFVCLVLNNQQNCFMSEQPYLILQNQYSKNGQEKYFQITVSQDVKYEDVQIQIRQLVKVQLQYQVYGIQTLVIDLQLLFQQIYDQITLDLILNGLIVNQYNQSLKSNKLEVMFSDMFILSDQQQQQSNYVSKLGQGVVITLTCLSVTSLLMGGTSQLIIFLNLIQQLQYIQYINILFPDNLIQFLNLFNGFSITPLFEFFQFDFPYIVPSQPRFAYNGINAYFLVNMKGFIFGQVAIFIIHIILGSMIHLMQNYKYHQLKSQKFTYHQLRQSNKIINFLIKISKKIKQQSLYAIIIALCYDNQFATFLQVNNPNMDNIDRIINIMLAVITQFYYLKYIFNQIVNEEVKNGKWQNLYNQLKLLQSFIFIFAIVQLQDFPQSQVLIISISSLTVSFYMIIIKPFENAFNNYRLIIQESILFITILTFIVYVYFPSQINPITLGWFHITNLIIMMTGSLVIDVYYYVIIIKKMY